MREEIKRNLFPLSLSQHNILDLEYSLSGTSVNNISTTIRIHGRLDLPVLQQTLNLLIEKDSTLRTRLINVDGEMMQYHLPYVKEEFPVFDFGNTSDEGIENWENAVTRELIPLEGGALYRFVIFKNAENGGGVLIKLHHIIADGWSLVMLCNKLGSTYLELLSGKAPSLEESPDYRLHVNEEQEYVSSRAYNKDERYWRSVLEQSSEPSSLRAVNSAAVSPVGRRMSFELPQILNHAIYTYCKSKRVAPFAVFYMALAIYFKRLGGADDFTIGVPIFNRTNYEFKQSTGMFVTTLPFYCKINDEWTFDQFNDELMERWYEMLRHQRYPFKSISRLAGKQDRLFNIVLSYQDSKIQQSRDAFVHFSGRWHYSGYQAEQLTIHLTNLKDHKQYAVDYDYLAQFFTEEEISALHKNICHILSEALSEPSREMHKLNVLSMDEKERLIYTFNKTAKDVRDVSVYDALAEGCNRYLNRVALIHNGERMTYGALMHRASRYAGAILEHSQGRGDLVAILLPRCADLVCAMVGALQAECAYLLLSEELPTQRILTVLEQSGAVALVTSARGKLRMEDASVPIIEVSDIDERFLMAYKRPDDGGPDGDMLAYVVYTSGSTGEPKGVEVSHAGLINLAEEMRDVYAQGAVLSVCNVGFDAFMLESIVALLNGRTIILPLDSELESPERLASLINGYAVGFFSMTPSRLSVFLQNEAFRKVMWRMESIICGGEQFPADLLKKLKLCTHARVYNQYGPSETTVAVSMKELTGARKITAGKPMGNCRLYVLDKWMNPLPVGGRGLLYVGGKCVGRGYRNRPDLTAESFIPDPFVADELIYRTGDIAYWTDDGEIVPVGRADGQVKLRGLRIELSEVSSCVESFKSITSAHAMVVSVNGTDMLAVYYTSAGEINEAELLSHVASYLPSYMVPSFVVRVDKIPVTSNGKVDEKQLPIPSFDENNNNDQATYTASQVLDVFKRVLNNNAMTVASDYFTSGGNSLNAMECVMELESLFARRLKVSDLYACRTAARVAQLIAPDDKAVCETVQKLKKAPAQTEYALTATQQGMYVQSAIDPNGLAYNMPGAFLLAGKPDVEKLTDAFKSMISAEPMLRTAFVLGQNGICAKIESKVDFEIENLSANNYQEACSKFIRPFALDKAPLLRVAVWNNNNDEHYLFIDSHHIIGDGITTSVMLNRLNEAYSGKNSVPEWTFYDYNYTVSSAKNDTKADVEYWKTHLNDIPEQLILPTDEPRPSKFDYKGDEVEYDMSANDTLQLEKFSREKGVSEYALFMAAYGLLLGKVASRDDFIVGTPVAGRGMLGTAGICGPFINTLPLRLRPVGSQTAMEWLSNVQSEISGMLDHQGISAEDIISELDLPRGEQNALYRVMMTQSPVNENEFRLGEDRLTYVPMHSGSVKMDIIFELARGKEGYKLRMSYATSLFMKQTVDFYCRCIINTVMQMIRRPELRLDEIDVLSLSDRDELIDGPNYAVTPFVNRPIHKILQNKAQYMSERDAIIFHSERTSFAALEKRASAIAKFIEDKGVEAGSCVAICMKRTPDLIATMYGVLKAGCAYMFMLDSFPSARLEYMLSISKAALLIYDENTAKALPDGFLDTDIGCEACIVPAGEADIYQDRAVGDDSLVNVLFTSGSTGRPKGVMLRHRSISNLYSQMKTLLDNVEGTVLCSTNTVFDCFVVETMIALALGRTVVLADEEEMMLPWKLAHLMSEYKTGIFEMTPSRLQMCLSNEDFCSAADNIKIVLLGGEVVTRALLEKFYAHSNGKIMNMYGPTEATVFTTMGHCTRDGHITIGTPLQNTRTYVLDDDMKLVIPTGCGELYIAGECLSLGYISRPELTEDSYKTDILFPDQKMYKTGDIVRLRVDGTFDYVGRKDSQIKLNGQRVELSEINCAIQSVVGVDVCATVAIKNDDGSSELCAFYTAKGSLSSNNVRDEISKQLPLYMVPSRIIRLGSMPMTATSKVDMHALSVMAKDGSYEELSDANDENVKNVPEVNDVVSAYGDVSTEYVLSVWNRVLSVPATNENESFFKQGGTSMAALSILSYFYNDKYEMSLSEFYQNPSAKAQSEFLKAKYFAEVSAVIEAEAVSAVPEEKNTVLITGATGFFGAHLLNELLNTTDAPIVCLLRDGDQNRLSDTLEWYFGEAVREKLTDRVNVLKGDISAEGFGLLADEHSRLAAKVNEIYHCAADVRHYADNTDEYISVNVGGTKNVVDFAVASGAVLYHMSTLSVSGETLKTVSEAKDFTEADFDIGQVWEDNIYVRSKFLAEQIVHKAIDNGLRAKIFRLGRIVGRAGDGKFQKNPETNAFYLLMKGFAQVGAIPAEGAHVRVDVMPVDICAQEVLALKNAEGKVFHIMNSYPPTLGEVFDAVSENGKMLPLEEFERLLISSDADRELIAILANTCQAAMSKDHNIDVINRITQKALSKVGYVPRVILLRTVLKEFWKGE